MNDRVAPEGSVQTFDVTLPTAPMSDADGPDERFWEACFHEAWKRVLADTRGEGLMMAPVVAERAMALADAALEIRRRVRARPPASRRCLLCRGDRVIRKVDGSQEECLRCKGTGEEPAPC
jgi:hypothetical protein